MGMGAVSQRLDPERQSSESQRFEKELRRRIVGQAEGMRALVDLYQVFCAGMCPQGRPVGNLLFLGPTGSGKTRIVEAAAEILFGDPRAVIRVDCAEFQHSHEIAKLIGSPPGYLGHRETHPLITQEALAQYHTEKLKLSFLLLDEIEKASDALWQLPSHSLSGIPTNRDAPSSSSGCVSRRLRPCKHPGGFGIGTPARPPRPGEALHPAPSARKSATPTAQQTALYAPPSSTCQTHSSRWPALT